MGPLRFELIAECATTRARASVVHLVHHSVIAPVFMPVGTQGTLKGLTTEQLEKQLDCQIMLANTYHLGHRPGPELIDKAGGLHKFMNWSRALLTDSGGFQMVSLAKLSEVREEGVSFESPHNATQMLLTPEHSIAIQHSIGADIVMQLDDVVHSSTTGERLEEAMLRSIRWLDRCIEAHKSRRETQNLFAIVQGGLNAELRRHCANEMIQRDVPGFAIGGLSGGEAKDDFWRMVSLSTEILPRDKPRYLMGVGYPVDLVVCTALGCDMFDCVYPSRTARFGTALVPSGLMNLNLSIYANDSRPIDKNCTCITCRTYTRAQLQPFAGEEAIASSLLTLHNLTYMIQLMRSMRQSIIEQRFPKFVQEFMDLQFPNKNYPGWVCDALSSVGLQLSSSRETNLEASNEAEIDQQNACLS